jgi:ABC-type Fe3+-hydroxamate transport system substrate-binding protein
MRNRRLSCAVAALAVLGLLATLGLAGCGSSSDETTGSAATNTGAAKTSTAPIGAAARICATNAEHADKLRVSGGVACGDARSVMAGWVRSRRGECLSPAGASRTSCTVEHWRCLGARTDQGVAVTCAQPGRSISFVALRR